jgi:hypothetical protein
MSGMPGTRPAVEGSYSTPADDGIMVVIDIQRDLNRPGTFTVVRQKIAVREGKLIKEGPVTHQNIEIHAISGHG